MSSKPHIGIGADIRQMLDMLLFHITQIATENERQALNP